MADLFIARENIKHFRARLEAEVDPTTRTTLQKLLVEEEDKLGTDQEHLADIRRHLTDGSQRIKRQQDRVSKMEVDGHNGLERARTLLAVMTDTHALFQHHYQQVLTAFLASQKI